MPAWMYSHAARSRDSLALRSKVHGNVANRQNELDASIPPGRRVGAGKKLVRGTDANRRGCPRTLYDSRGSTRRRLRSRSSRGAASDVVRQEISRFTSNTNQTKHGPGVGRKCPTG